MSSSSAKSLYLLLHKTDSQVLGVIASFYQSSSVFSSADALVIPLLCLTPQSLSHDQEIKFSKSHSHWLFLGSVVIASANQYFLFYPSASYTFTFQLSLIVPSVSCTTSQLTGVETPEHTCCLVWFGNKANPDLHITGPIVLPDSLYFN